jgi:iron complex outermembrane receptor protein
MAYPTDGTAGLTLRLNLRPVITMNLVKSTKSLGNFTAAVFQSNTQDDIVSAGTLNGRATYQNADKTIRQGLELSWNKKLWKDLTAQASYSFLDATFDADIPNTDPKKVIQSGNYIPGIAKNQAFVSFGWLPEQGFNAWCRCSIYG